MEQSQPIEKKEEDSEDKPEAVSEQELVATSEGAEEGAVQANDDATPKSEGDEAGGFDDQELDEELIAQKKKEQRKEKIDFLRGRLSWRIISTVFVTILIVQGAILYFTAQSRENDALDTLVEAGRSAVAPLLYERKIPQDKKFFTFLEPNVANRILSTTDISGLAIYSEGQNVTNDLYGEPPILTPSFLRREENRGVENVTLYQPENDRYEILLTPKDLKAPYFVSLRLNTDLVGRTVRAYLQETIVIVFLLSALVTTVLMLVLGKWLLEPILILRNNLKRAAKDPTKPKKYYTYYKRSDELGSVIKSANQLIRQNAYNISKLSKRAQDKIYKIAYFDSLTGLPNRLLYLHKLQSLINKIRNQTEPRELYIIAMDLDNFGDINDTLGFEAGDYALKMIAARLKKVLPKKSILARLGEDQFAAILLSDQRRFNAIIDLVLRAFRRPFDVQGNEYLLEISAGVCVYPDHADNAQDLLKKAETALDQTKQEERGSYRMYTEEFEKAVQDRIQMVRDLRVAVAEGQFHLVYHPQFDAETRQLIGAEALIRWMRPMPGEEEPMFVRPDIFIGLAEQSGLIVPIGKWVMNEAARFAKQCQDNGLPKFRVAINLSGVQFYRDDIVARTKEMLEDNEIDPSLIELEVTESVVMKDVEETIRILEELKKLGVDLAIDDFGTGYSSLAYLKRFPVDRLKIDRAFIMNVTEDPDDAAITRTIIQLGHSLGLKVIAEGVETEGHIDFLKNENCDELQGFYFTKPLPGIEFSGYLRGMGTSTHSS